MNRLHLFIFVIIAAGSLGMITDNAFSVSESDSLALVALYNSTDGDNWTDNTNWLSTNPVSDWYGITVGDGRVTELDLRTNNLVGSIPPEIGSLTHLTKLFLVANQLSGSIPYEFGNLINLVIFVMGGNQLSGSIPSEIGNLTNLTEMYIEHNQLSGSIPSEIVNLTNLERIFLEDNQLSGSVPTQIGNLTNLIGLRLDRNQLSGAIPNEILNLTSLQYLNLYSNQFTDLPDLSSITTLTELIIYNNQFTFEDIEPNIGISTFHYAPQAAVGEERNITVTEGSNMILSVSVGGTANQYQWKKDMVDIPGAMNSSYTVGSVDSSHAGSYTCVISNSIAVDLTLISNPINVTILEAGPCNPGDVNCDDAITPGDALCAFWRSILGSFQEECDCGCSEQVADVNCDGTITPGGALCIFWRSILGEWQEECQCSP